MGGAAISYGIMALIMTATPLSMHVLQGHSVENTTAELIAKGEPGPLCAEFGMERFIEGRFIDESVAAGVAH